jgi:peptide/nickel transport system permease protein/oligopeptide transport system permease protein
MIYYIVKRLLISIPVVWGVVTLTFLSVHLLPGDPAEAMLSQGGGSAENIAQLRRELGLDRPLVEQYRRYWTALLRGDAGRSLFTNIPVAQSIVDYLPHTVELATAAMLIATVSGVSLGVIAATTSLPWLDILCMSISAMGVSIPIFWSGLLLILLFSSILHWLPASGQDGVRQLILPASALGFASTGAISQVVRNSMLDVLSQKYITVARAKGLARRQVIVQHALKNTFVSSMTVIGLQFGSLLAGTVITETVFSRQGLGRFLVDAILWKDLPIVQGTVLVIALVHIFINLLTDIAYAIIDPRIRYE